MKTSLGEMVVAMGDCVISVPKKSIRINGNTGRNKKGQNVAR